jgi:hypothetical protein
MRKLTIPLGICAIALALYVGLSYIVPELKPGLAAPIIIIAFIGAVGTVTMAFLTRSLGRKAEVITTKSLLAFRRGLWVAPCSCGGEFHPIRPIFQSWTNSCVRRFEAL